MLQEPNEFNPTHYYLAQISADIVRGNAKHPERIKIKDKILNFVFKRTSSVSGEFEKDVTTDRIAVSKAAWKMMGAFGKRLKNGVRFIPRKRDKE